MQYVYTLPNATTFGQWQKDEATEGTLEFVQGCVALWCKQREL